MTDRYEITSRFSAEDIALMGNTTLENTLPLETHRVQTQTSETMAKLSLFFFSTQVTALCNELLILECILRNTLTSSIKRIQYQTTQQGVKTSMCMLAFFEGDFLQENTALTQMLVLSN